MRMPLAPAGPATIAALAIPMAAQARIPQAAAPELARSPIAMAGVMPIPWAKDADPTASLTGT